MAIEWVHDIGHSPNGLHWIHAPGAVGRAALAYNDRADLFYDTDAKAAIIAVSLTVTAEPDAGGAIRRQGWAPLAVELLEPDGIAVVTTSPAALGAVAWGCDGKARVCRLAARFAMTKAAFDRFHPVPGGAAYYRLVSDPTATVVADCP